MDYEPDEIIGNILGFVPDKIYVSMVCKKWNKLLDDMYGYNKNQFLGDVYYLQKYYSEFGYDNCVKYIPQIVNHQCLNFMCHIVKKKEMYEKNRNINAKLLLQSCKTNNVSKPQDIRKFHDDFNTDILRVVFDNKSYDILVILLLDYDVITLWWKLYLRETNIDILIEHINMFVDKCICGWITIYKTVKGFVLKNELLEYVKIKMRPDILRLIK